MCVSYKLGYLKKFRKFRILNNLRYGLASKTGCNFLGRITVYTRSKGLQSLKYRLVSYNYKMFSSGFILEVIKDKRRNGFIGLVFFLNGFLTHLLLPEGKNLGDFFLGFSLKRASLKFSGISQGIWSFLFFFPLGSFLFNIETTPYKGGVLCRAAGCFAFLVSRDLSLVTLKLRSG